MVDGDRTEQAGAMTTTPPEAPSGPPADNGGPDHHDGGPHDGHQEQGPRVSRDEVRNLGRVRRSAYDRKIAGVAGGLARHFDIDPIILRVAFVVLTFFGGAGLIVYGACWILVPDERTENATVRLDERSRTVALAIVGLIAALALIGDSVGGWGFPWPLAIVGLVVLAVMAGRGDRRPGGPPWGYGPPPGVSPQQPTGPYAAPYAQSYAQSYAQPQAGPAYVPVPRPRNPRRRGPILFWFTLALIALSLGVLGIVDLAGAAVQDPAYPALALAVTGVMLLVGAFYGRAGGLIAVGLVAALATAGSTAAGEVDAGQIDTAPRLAAAVDDSYTVTAGQIVLDLSRVTDLDALDGRTIDLDVTFGQIEVIVPEGLDVDVDAVVNAGGHSALFGDDVNGSDSYFYDAGDGVPLLRLNAEVTFGEIKVDLTGRNN